MYSAASACLGIKVQASCVSIAGLAEAQPAWLQHAASAAQA